MPRRMYVEQSSIEILNHIRAECQMQR